MVLETERDDERAVSIIGGASGNRRLMKKFQRMYKDIYRYYGVTEEDIREKSKRYEDVVRTLCQ